MTNDEKITVAIHHVLSEQADALVPPSGWACSLDELLRRAASGRSTRPMTVVRRARWISVIATAAAVAAAVAVTSAVLPSPSAEAWSATPTLANADAWARLESACQQQTSMESTAKAVIVEERGDSNFTVLADANMCLQVSFDGRPSEPASGGSELLPAALPGAGEVQVIHSNVLWSMGHGSMDDPNGVTLTRGYVDTVGRVGPGVENIVIHTVDNGDVTASIDNGWFAAWWPSFEQLPTSMTVVTVTGSYTVHL